MTTHPDDEQTPFVTVERRLVSASQEVSSFNAEVGDVTDPMELAYLARHLQVLGMEVREAYRDARRMTACAMGEKVIDVPFIGPVEALEGRKREWKLEPLIATLVARLADEWDGGPPHAFAEHVASVLQRTIKFDYARVGALKSEGINPNDFCEWKDTGPDIKLPPLGKSDDPFAFPDEGAA